MVTFDEWLYGPKRESNYGNMLLRSYRLTLNELARVVGVMRVPFGNDEIPKVILRATSGAPVDEAAWSSWHPRDFEGSTLFVEPIGDRLQAHVSWPDGRIQIHQASGPDRLADQIAEAIERTARPRMRPGRALALLSTLVPVLGFGASIWAITAQAWIPMAVALITALLGVVVSFVAFRTAGSGVWAQTVVEPVLWRDVVRTRRTAIVAIVAAAISAAATLAAVFVPQLIP